jgi:hypothetical protein
MKLSHFLVALFLSILTACSNNKPTAATIDFDTCIKGDSGFLLTQQEKNQKTKAIHYEANPIEYNTEMHRQLLSWLHNNKTNWQTSTPPGESAITISQGDFSLQYLGRRVLISLPIEGRIHHYLKIIKEGELDFLLQKNS